MKKLIDNIEKVVVGKSEVVRQAVIALLCEGHLLIEDVPGVGKTVLAKALSASLTCDLKRLQFTPDLLPSDVTGSNVFNQKEERFHFREGPVFTNILLADEINRGTPRTQSSLLECMEERQVSCEGVTRPLPSPFFVIATQNPIELQGTYPLPEAQLDRFLMKIDVGYPNLAEEVEIMNRQTKRHPLEDLGGVMSVSELTEAQKNVREIHVDESLLGYVAAVVRATREHQDVRVGSSPRGSLALRKAAQAAAFLDGVSFVKPDHIKRLARPVLCHRIIPNPQARLTGVTPLKIVNDSLASVDVPIQ